MSKTLNRYSVFFFTLQSLWCITSGNFISFVNWIEWVSKASGSLRFYSWKKYINKLLDYYSSKLSPHLQRIANPKQTTLLNVENTKPWLCVFSVTLQFLWCMTWENFIFFFKLDSVGLESVRPIAFLFLEEPHIHTEEISYDSCRLFTCSNGSIIQS